jgi:hypothetical protein
MWFPKEPEISREFWKRVELMSRPLLLLYSIASTPPKKVALLPRGQKT